MKTYKVVSQPAIKALGLIVINNNNSDSEQALRA